MAMNEDWDILLSFFPDKWKEIAVASDAIKGLRKEKDTENYLRTLLLHLACGYSMRETVVRAKLANLADISDVAFLGRLIKTKGQGTGESFFQFSIKKGDYIIADRGYSTSAGIHHIASKKAYVMVRVNTQSLIIQNLNGGEFPLLENVMGIRKAGAVRSWQVQIPGRKSNVVVGRICIIRKTEEAIKIAQAKLRRNAQKKGHSLKPETLEYAKYVIVFTTFPEESFNDIDVLEWYRIRWQVELIFKRFKSIRQLGHLPKHSDDTSKARLYGKLFAALLTEKLIKHASSVSPWGYILEEQPASEYLA